MTEGEIDRLADRERGTNIETDRPTWTDRPTDRLQYKLEYSLFLQYFNTLLHRYSF